MTEKLPRGLMCTPVTLHRPLLQTLKNRVGGHLQDTHRLLRDRVHSSTLTSHLSQVWQHKSNSIPTAGGVLRYALSCNILWQGNPFSCSKTFGKLSCKLCQKEPVVLLRYSWTDGSNMMNYCSEIHGSCCHQARFHGLTIRFGTDDPD
jgi:hypothetical protein